MGVIKKIKPNLIVLNGHGSSDMILGQNDEILVKVGENEYILNNALVYALSCGSAKTLGPASVSAGAKAYIGYTEDFIFFVTDNYSTRPEQDPTAKLFLEPTNIIVNALINGNTAENSHQKGLNQFTKNIQAVLSSSSSEEYLARYLIWDMISQVCLGDPTAVIWLRIALFWPQKYNLFI